MAATFFIVKLVPPEIKALPPHDRLAFQGVVAEFVLKRKDWELARGLNAKGEPLPPVSAKTRKHRRSEMTPSGKGDPTAPYLMPGRKLSRTRSLLTARAHSDHVVVGWRFDAWTGDQWGKILAIHARRGERYDVVGLSAKGRAWVLAKSLAAFRAWKAGKAPLPLPPVPSAMVPAAGPVPVVGRTNLEHAVGSIVGDIEASKTAIAEGRSTGFLTIDEWRKHLRSSTAPIAARPGVPASIRQGRSNVLLQHVWGGGGRPPATFAAPAVPSPKPAPKIAKAALKPEVAGGEPRPGPEAASARPKVVSGKPSHAESLARARAAEFASEGQARAWAEGVYGGRWDSFYTGRFGKLASKRRGELAGTPRWWELLTNESRNDVKDYTGNAFRQLNAKLRSDVPIHPTQWYDKAFRGYVKTLDGAMGDAAPTPRDVVLYRGVGHPDMFLNAVGAKTADDLKPGFVFHDRAYTSTTISPDYAEIVAQEHPGDELKFKVLVPAGSDGFFIGDNSTLPEEKEFLLGRSLDTFEVVGRDGDWIVLRAYRSSGG